MMFRPVYMWDHMKYYRLELMSSQIGVILDTLTRDNMARCAALKDSQKLIVLNSVVNLSLEKDIPLSSSWQIHRQKNPELDYYIQNVWEILYEHAKPRSIDICHYDCAFFFINKANAIAYSRYPGMKNAQLCEVEIIDEYNSFLGDMQWIERIDENTAKASDIIDAFKHYWLGELTNDPIPELLFKGKYRLIPLS